MEFKNRQQLIDFLEGIRSGKIKLPRNPYLWIKDENNLWLSKALTGRKVVDFESFEKLVQEHDCIVYTDSKHVINLPGMKISVTDQETIKSVEKLFHELQRE